MIMRRQSGALRLLLRGLGCHIRLAIALASRNRRTCIAISECQPADGMNTATFEIGPRQVPLAVRREGIWPSSRTNGMTAVGTKLPFSHVRGEVRFARLSGRATPDLARRPLHVRYRGYIGREILTASISPVDPKRTLAVSLREVGFHHRQPQDAASSVTSAPASRAGRCDPLPRSADADSPALMWFAEPSAGRLLDFQLSLIIGDVARRLLKRLAD